MARKTAACAGMPLELQYLNGPPPERPQAGWFSPHGPALNIEKWFAGARKADMFFSRKDKKAQHPAPEAAQPKGEAPVSSQPVKLFALSTCSHCKSTRKLLDDHDVAYECVEVDQTSGEERTDLIAEVKKYNPACSFPTLVIGEKVIVGFRENEIKGILGL